MLNLGRVDPNLEPWAENMAAHAGKTQQLPHQKTVGCVLLEFRRGYQDDKQYQERSLYFMNYLLQKKPINPPEPIFPNKKSHGQKIHRSKKKVPWIDWRKKNLASRRCGSSVSEFGSAKPSWYHSFGT